MGFFKFLIGFIITGRVLMVIAFIIISIAIFYIFSDANFVTETAGKIGTIIENNANNIVNWLVDYIEKIKEMF